MAKRVAVIHPGALGDLILALPLMQLLAQGHGELELFAASSRAEFLAGHSVVTVGHSLDSPDLACLFSAEGTASTERPDSPPHSQGARGALQGLNRIISAYPHERFNRNLAAAAPGARVDFLDIRPSAVEQSGLHASAFLCRQLFPERADLPLPRIGPTAKDRAAAAGALAEAGAAAPAGSPGKLLLIHPGSGGRAKCWPTSCFIGVADRLADAGWRVAFVLGETEAERMPPAERAALAGRFPTLAGLTLGQLAGLIASADGYLGNDAGPTHLAAAVGRATVALFGPTRPGVWAPRGRRVTVLRGEVSAGPDWAIAPAAVADAVLKSQAGPGAAD